MRKYLLRIRPEQSTFMNENELTLPWLDDFATGLALFWPKEERDLLLDLLEHYECDNQLKWFVLLMLNHEFDPDELPPLPPSSPPNSPPKEPHKALQQAADCTPTESGSKRLLQLSFQHSVASEIGSFDEEQQDAQKESSNTRNGRNRFIGDMTKYY